MNADPAIDAAIDAALALTEIPVTELPLDGWGEALGATYSLMDSEAIACDGSLLADPESNARLGTLVRERLTEATAVTTEQADQARVFQGAWKATFDRLFGIAELLVLPTVAAFPPTVASGGYARHTRCTAPINLAGLPALALPLSTSNGVPVSIQLVGPANSEELLLTTGALIEAAAGYRRS